MLPDLNPMVGVHMPDKVEMEREYIECLSEVSGINASAVGPGLDSDFGASAGMLHTDQHGRLPYMDTDCLYLFRRLSADSLSRQRCSVQWCSVLGVGVGLL